jgi:hypothetical protein
MPDVEYEYDTSRYIYDAFTPDELDALNDTTNNNESQNNNDDIAVPILNTNKTSKNNVQVVIEKDVNYDSISNSVSSNTSSSTPSSFATTYTYKTIHREKQFTYKTPDSKSKSDMLLDGDLPYEYPFSCEGTCTQHISYKLLSSIPIADYKQFDLDKLDIVLNSESTFIIQVDCTLNGLDTLEYPSWIEESLNKVGIINISRLINN